MGSQSWSRERRHWHRRRGSRGGRKFSGSQSARKATLPPKALGEKPFLPPPASGGYRHSSACDCRTAVSASVLPWTSPLLSVCPSSVCIFYKTPAIGFRVHSDTPRWSYFENLIISAKPPFSNKVTFTGTRDWDVDMYFGGPPFNPL